MNLNDKPFAVDDAKYEHVPVDKLVKHGHTSHDSCPSTSRSNTSSLHRVWAYTLEPDERTQHRQQNRRGEGGVHRRILQHVRDNEEADHAPPNVDLIEL